VKVRWDEGLSPPLGCLGGWWVWTILEFSRHPGDKVCVCVGGHGPGESSELRPKPRGTLTCQVKGMYQRISPSLQEVQSFA
jgi:hypothetical protein